DYSKNSTSLIALTYAYDRNGNKVGGSEEGTLDWEPDDITDYDESTDFTPAGKMITRTDAAPDTPKVFSYEYDDSGNMTRASTVGETYDLTYDEDNRTTSITWDTGLSTKTIQNRYDGIGRRVSRILDGDETRYVLDLAGSMERVLCDFSPTGSPECYYVYSGDLCFKVDQSSGSATTFLGEASGNVVAICDSAGSINEKYAYTPYGRSIGSWSTSENQYLFVGSQGACQELPSLIFMRARYYSTESGNFLSIDPVKKIGPSWQPVSYTYSLNNPLKFNDPHGEFAIAAAWYGIEQTGLRAFNKLGTPLAVANAIHSGDPSGLGVSVTTHLVAGEAAGFLPGAQTLQAIETAHELGKWLSWGPSALTESIPTLRIPTLRTKSGLAVFGVGKGSLLGELKTPGVTLLGEDANPGEPWTDDSYRRVWGDDGDEENSKRELSLRRLHALRQALAANGQQGAGGGERVRPKRDPSTGNSPGAGG
ncbi:MAG: hypothetical protein KDD44_12070, partial [Bdellovibrionales bacterium]|nr:hypothetical protein [Bdellovibrionales bacterium]